ncbi:MAG: hypothetical protein AB7H97_11675, partial [Pseudobdellovibrionaceae bacterium]
MFSTRICSTMFVILLLSFSQESQANRACDNLKMIQDLIPAVNLSPSEHKISFEMTKGFWGDYQSLTIVIDNLKYMTFSSQATKEGSLMTFFNNKD